ncbi:MAG TPA: hypothetical protein VM537_29010 [Anaerolineae bacterium]|nr:hypothetical protein [Anaerolineae bacterium]
MREIKKVPNRRKNKDLRLKIEPALREKLERIAAIQRRSVPNLAEFYISTGAEREYAEARA